jgi:hypothetical protein
MVARRRSSKRAKSSARQSRRRSRRSRSRPQEVVVVRRRARRSRSRRARSRSRGRSRARSAGFGGFGGFGGLGNRGYMVATPRRKARKGDYLCTVCKKYKPQCKCTCHPGGVGSPFGNFGMGSSPQFFGQIPGQAFSSSQLGNLYNMPRVHECLSPQYDAKGVASPYLTKSPTLITFAGDKKLQRLPLPSGIQLGTAKRIPPIAAHIVNTAAAPFIRPPILDDKSVPGLGVPARARYCR